MAGRLNGKVAVVTGAANGIGRGCAERFAAEGAQVIAVDRAFDDEGPPAAMQRFSYDLTDETAVATLAARITDEVGRVDILLNAAAFATFAWIEDLSYADWRRTLTGELDIVFLLTKALWPLLRIGGRSSVINFASANAHHALAGSPALAHCAGKGGVLAMTRQLAMEGGAHGIRVNAISPGFIRTAATEAHMRMDSAIVDQVMAKNMVKRIGDPDDIAYCAVWLGSDEAGYVTGADIAVDGGTTAW